MVPGSIGGNQLQIIIHAGCPRTGTTVLQKHVFRKLKHTPVFSKNPFEGAFGNHSNRSSAEAVIFRKIMDYVFRESVNPHEKSSNEYLLDGLLDNYASFQNLLISTEWLVDTGASLTCHSNLKPDGTKQYPLYALIGLTYKLNRTPLISICLREGFSYLRSKYCRTVIQRRALKERFLTPHEFIKKQAALEAIAPGASALAPAMHAEFIKKLQQHAFVKAFGFQELLASDDVFSLMGLQGEGKYAFRDFPRENKLPVAEEQEKVIEAEITQALKQYGFYDRIMKSQMFE